MDGTCGTIMDGYREACDSFRKELETLDCRWLDAVNRGGQIRAASPAPPASLPRNHAVEPQEVRHDREG